MKNTTHLPIKKNIKLEIVGLFFCSIIPGFIWMATLISGLFLVNKGYHLAILALPFLISLVYISLCFIIRCCIPKLVEGSYHLEKDPMVIYWYMHMSLNRSLNATGLRAIIRSSNILKFLYYRALGAKIAYTANYSTDLEIIDPSMITMEKDVIIGGRCIIGCHLIYNNKLVLKPVHLKEKAFIQLNNGIGQGVTVGKSAVVGNGNLLYNIDIPDNYKVNNFAWANGTPNQKSWFKKKQEDYLLKNDEYHNFHKEHGFI